MSSPTTKTETQADAPSTLQPVASSEAPTLAKSNATTPSKLLNLPAEVRNIIGRFCQPTAGELEVNLCTCSADERCIYDDVSACIALSRVKEQNDLVRSIRFLQLVNHQVYAETEPLMRYGKTLVFCDDLCLRDCIMAMPVSERRLVASIKVNHIVELLSTMEYGNLLAPNDALRYFVERLGACWKQIALSRHEVVIYDHEASNYVGVRFARVEIAVGDATSSRIRR